MATDRTYVQALVRIDKWDPAHLELKNQIEERLRVESDAKDDSQHARCHTPGQRGGGADRPDTCAPDFCAHPGLTDADEIHVDCAYGTAHLLALTELAAQGIHPIETIEDRNQVVNTGLTDFGNGLIGGSLTVYSNANAGLAMGTSSAAVAVTQADLQAATGAANRWTQGMDATYPTLSNGVTTWRATVSTANGNFSVQEMALTNNTVNVGTSNALTRILNRFLTTPGTKTASQSWQVTITLTLA